MSYSSNAPGSHAPTSEVLNGRRPRADARLIAAIIGGRHPQAKIGVAGPRVAVRSDARVKHLDLVGTN